MLLNFSGATSPYSIERVELPPFRPHKLRVLSILGMLREYATPGLYKITCDLIEREPGNQHKILGFVIINRKQLFIEFQPTHSIWYKLRYHEISFADVKIQSTKTDEILIFDEFSIQFEVSDSYVGVQ